MGRDTLAETYFDGETLRHKKDTTPVRRILTADEMKKMWRRIDERKKTLDKEGSS